MFRNMVTSLFKHERIRTTDAKAKELRRWADHLITLAKRGDLHARRQALSIVREKNVVHKLFENAADRFGGIAGGYTRIIKIGQRPGDAASISMIELVLPETVKEKPQRGKVVAVGNGRLKDDGTRHVLELKKGDVVICVTEGGETSSVIGTILAALDQWKSERGYSPEKSRKNLFFVYNNPDERLLPFERSRKVLEEPGITKINLTTGPQSITGSTRMQATTIETFVIGHVLQTALDRALRQVLSKKDMSKLGFRKPK